jgi:hypothetical protein
MVGDVARPGWSRARPTSGRRLCRERLMQSRPYRRFVCLDRRGPREVAGWNRPLYRPLLVRSAVSFGNSVVIQATISSLVFSRSGMGMIGSSPS